MSVNTFNCQTTYKTKPSDEIQSILELLTRKQHNQEPPFRSFWINLSGAYLVGAYLKYAQFQGAILFDANFQGANLKKEDAQEILALLSANSIVRDKDSIMKFFVKSDMDYFHHFLKR